MTTGCELADVRKAAERIAGRVRRTPTVTVAPTRAALVHPLDLKLECLQVTGSFKARGAMNALALLPPDAVARGIVTASGGNHGLAVAYAGHVARQPARIYVPANVPEAKRAKLAAWGARVIVVGAVWDEANVAALADAAETGAAYVHPFANPAVIAGQGTVALEIVADAPDTATILVAIGGGGLISGIALAAKALKPGIRVIGIEPTGAPTLHASRKAGRLVELERIETEAGTLAPRRSEAINFEIIERNVDDIVLVTDDEMREAARWLWFELGIAAELSGAAAMAALLAGRYAPRPGERVCALVCGAGTDGILGRGAA